MNSKEKREVSASEMLLKMAFVNKLKKDTLSCFHKEKAAMKTLFDGLDYITPWDHEDPHLVSLASPSHSNSLATTNHLLNSKGGSNNKLVRNFKAVAEAKETKPIQNTKARGEIKVTNNKEVVDGKTEVAKIKYDNHT